MRGGGGGGNMWSSGGSHGHKRIAPPGISLLKFPTFLRGISAGAGPTPARAWVYFSGRDRNVWRLWGYETFLSGGTHV